MAALDCEVNVDFLAMQVDHDRLMHVADWHHIKSCLHCQVKQIRYKHLLQAMSSLRWHSGIEIPEELEQDRYCRKAAFRETVKSLAMLCWPNRMLY